MIIVFGMLRKGNRDFIPRSYFQLFLFSLENSDGNHQKMIPWQYELFCLFEPKQIHVILLHFLRCQTFENKYFVFLPYRMYKTNTNEQLCNAENWCNYSSSSLSKLFQTASTKVSTNKLRYS